MGYFNSRPSARGDACSDSDCWISSISIHAPPRGATGANPAILRELIISIHAPPRGATATSTPFRTRRRNFNSRPSARGDTGIFPSPVAYFYFNSRPSARGDSAIDLTPEKGFISIHAPPRGATIAFLLSSRNPRISIHAPPRGATRWQVVLHVRRGRFQFTPLREGRLGSFK